MLVIECCVFVSKENGFDYRLMYYFNKVFLYLYLVGENFSVRFFYGI